ncbi:MAG: DNRLRE domain-containing protein [Candidatus Aegiribacteria sp.]|nr:DNRLRE domain-containing protein [Candidatus Aegiribacteria sp.]
MTPETSRGGIMKIASCLIMALVFCLGGFLRADVSYENPTQDAEIQEWNPDENYGSEDHFNAGFVTAFIGWLMEFDLTEYEGADVNSAILAMYCVNNTGEMRELIAFRLNSSWSESTVTYGNRPYTNTDLSVTFTPEGIDQWIQVDITEIVQSWLDGSFTNNGLSFGPTETLPPGEVKFWSKEYSNSSLHPVLQIDYELSSLETTTFGRIKTLF